VRSHQRGWRLVASGTKDACDAAKRLMETPDVKHVAPSDCYYERGRKHTLNEATLWYDSPPMTLCKSAEGLPYTTRTK
jgi:hypothetical protein